MLISQVINKIKAYHRGENVDEATTKDRVLYGNPETECTGIVTTCWATADVIRKAHEKGANLIICHEALFWNHGDKTDWLIRQRNKTFAKKKQLLDETGIVVWRDHDYIHSGIPVGERYYDGIFYGVAKTLGWEEYITADSYLNMEFMLPETTAEEIGRLLKEKFHLEGIRLMGNEKTKVKKVWLTTHCFGVPKDSEVITYADENNIDLIIPLECVDFTFSEYVRDSSMLGITKAMVMPGHFNGEEPGMEFMLTYINEAIGEDIPCTFVQSGDMFHYIV